MSTRRKRNLKPGRNLKVLLARAVAEAVPGTVSVVDILHDDNCAAMNSEVVRKLYETAYPYVGFHKPTCAFQSAEIDACDCQAKPLRAALAAYEKGADGMSTPEKPPTTTISSPSDNTEAYTFAPLPPSDFPSSPGPLWHAGYAEGVKATEERYKRRRFFAGAMKALVKAAQKRRRQLEARP